MSAILLEQSYMLNTSSYGKKNTNDHMQLYLSKVKYILELRLYVIGIHWKKIEIHYRCPLVFREISKQGGICSDTA